MEKNLAMKKIFNLLFPRSGATWLFWWTGIYAVIAVYSVFVAPVASIELIQAAWLLICALPLFVPPLARFLRMRTLWK